MEKTGIDKEQTHKEDYSITLFPKKKKLDLSTMLNIFSVKIHSKLILSPFWSYCSIFLQGDCLDFICVLGTKTLNQINVIENTSL